MSASAPAAAGRSRPALPALTGLRFVAAFGVVLYHFVRFKGPASPLNVLMQNGHIAVQFFFLLSGFILAYNYLDPSRPLDRGRFWAARFARIYAVYLTAMLAFVPFFWVKLRSGHGYEVGEAIRHLAIITPLVTTMTQTWYPVAEIAGEWNTPAWSLSCEAFFYAVFPLAAIYFAQLGRRGVALTIVGSWLAAAVLVLWVVPRLPERAALAGIEGPLSWGIHPIPHLPTFLAGIAWGRAFLLARESPRLAPVAGVASTVLLALVLAFLALYPGSGPGDNVLLLVFPAFGLLLFALAWQRGPAARLLSAPWIVLLGEASYALYMFHAPVWAYFQQAWSRGLGRPAVGPAFNASYLVIVVGASIAVHRLVEHPARRWVTRRLSPQRERTAARPAVDVYRTVD